MVENISYMCEKRQIKVYISQIVGQKYEIKLYISHIVGEKDSDQSVYQLILVKRFRSTASQIVGKIVR